MCVFFFTFPCDILGQVWCLIASIPDLCLLSYFYNSLTDDLYNTNWDTLKSNDIDIYTSNITKRIIDTSKKHIPNKTIKIRQYDPKWPNTNIKKALRKKNG